MYRDFYQLSWLSFYLMRKLSPLWRSLIQTWSKTLNKGDPVNFWDTSLHRKKIEEWLLWQGRSCEGAVQLPTTGQLSHQIKETVFSVSIGKKKENTEFSNRDFICNVYIIYWKKNKFLILSITEENHHKLEEMTSSLDLIYILQIKLLKKNLVDYLVRTLGLKNTSFKLFFKLLCLHFITDSKCEDLQGHYLCFHCGLHQSCKEL